MKHFTRVADVPDVHGLIELGLQLKQVPYAHEALGRHRTLGLLFLNPSLRTRLSTQKAAQNLGMQVLTMNVTKDGWQLEFADGVRMDGDKAEHIREAAGVLGRYVDILGVRAFPTLKDRELDYSEQIISQLQQHAGVPIVSLESATRHPLQSLADMMTLREQTAAAQSPTAAQGPVANRPRVVLAWAPHPRALPQAVPNSFAEWALATGYDLHIAQPPGYELDSRFTQGAEIHHELPPALVGADYVYAKNWSTYEPYGQVLTQDPSWMLTEAMLASRPTTKVMHCLPVRRDVALAAELLDGHRSLVLQQAENRIYAAQAVLYTLLQTLKG